jgi:cathepsin L
MYKTAIAVAALAATATAESTREKYESMFVEHMQKYDLEFKEGSEFVHRLELFIQSIEKIEKHNADPSQTFTMGLNQFSHLTESEWRDAVHLGSTHPPFLRRNDVKIHGEPLTAPPASIDWVAKGAVTSVKNQGQCGSCWSFSAAGSMEGGYFLKTGNLVNFAEQELVSCDTLCQGCNGGWMNDAFQWVMNTGGIQSATTTPYTSGTTEQSGTCQGTGNAVPGSAPSSYTNVQPGSVSALMDAVAQQPVSIAIQANQQAFQYYNGGVITANCGTELDHGVLIVGYGTTSGGTDYWKVKNSWGTTWGEDGYVRIERSSADLCGVMMAPSYPVY